MKTYNDIPIPILIRTDLIISAFQNEIDSNKVEEYTIIMKTEMLGHDFPPILGFPTIITEDDIENQEYFLNGEPVDEHHIGYIAWKVTDGHHRTLAAINAHLPHLAVELDYSCITNQKEL